MFRKYLIDALFIMVVVGVFTKSEYITIAAAGYEKGLDGKCYQCS